MAWTVFDQCDPDALAAWNAYSEDPCDATLTALLPHLIEDFPSFCALLLKIKPKGGGYTAPFLFNQVQRRIWREICMLIEQRKLGNAAGAWPAARLRKPVEKPTTRASRSLSIPLEAAVTGTECIKASRSGEGPEMNPWLRQRTVDEEVVAAHGVARGGGPPERVGRQAVRRGAAEIDGLVQDLTTRGGLQHEARRLRRELQTGSPVQNPGSMRRHTSQRMNARLKSPKGAMHSQEGVRERERASHSMVEAVMERATPASGLGLLGGVRASKHQGKRGAADQGVFRVRGEARSAAKPPRRGVAHVKRVAGDVAPVDTSLGNPTVGAGRGAELRE